MKGEEEEEDKMEEDFVALDKEKTT